MLLDLVHAAAGSKLAQLAALFSRLDDLSHVLAWARCDAAKEPSRPQGPHDVAQEAAADEKGWAASGLPLGLALVELPRLRLSFGVRLQRWGVAAGGAGPGAAEEVRRHRHHHEQQRSPPCSPTNARLQPCRPSLPPREQGWLYCPAHERPHPNPYPYP